MASTRRSHLWPLEGASIPGVPARELLVDPDVADDLMAYSPPAFARSKPDDYDPAPYHAAEDLDEDGKATPLEWTTPPPPEPEPEEPPQPVAFLDAEEPA